MNALTLTSDRGRRAIDPAQVVASARAGEVVVIPQAMQRMGLHAEIVETTLDAICDACGANAAAEIGRRGIEKLHEVLNGAQIERAGYEIDRRLIMAYPRWMKVIGREVLGLKRPFYIPLIAFTRLSIPKEIAASSFERFTLEKSPVLLNRFLPHRDCWFTSPINTLNAWIAIGAVEPENGLYFYPEMWGEDLTLDERDRRDLGTPLKFAVEAGDIVLFDNRQLHATADNIGSLTRLALSGRLCPEPPIAPRADALDVISLWSPLIGTRFERLAGAATKLSCVYAVERFKRRATRAVVSIERLTGGESLRGVRQALRYRRADRPFGA